MEDSDEIRGLIRRRIAELGLDDADVSRRIGRGRTYLHDYFVKRSPKVMPDKQKLLLAPILKVSPAQLGVAAAGIASLRWTSGGMAEDDIVDYMPGPDFPVPPAHISLKQIVNRALDQHPLGLVPGVIIPFNTRLINPAEIEPGAVVWVQMAQRSDPLRFVGSVVRQFLPPDKLVTNSSEGNEIIPMDDPDRDVVASIMGTMAPYRLTEWPSSPRLREDTVAVTRDEAQTLNRS